MVTRPPKSPQKSAVCALHFGHLFVALTLMMLSGCATPGVTKGTGRVIDPPLELILYCLIAPADPACRAILK